MDERLSRELWLTHLERVLALSDANSELLGPEDRREIALEIGISEADLALAEALAGDHYLRGTGFAEQSMWKTRSPS